MPLGKTNAGVEVGAGQIARRVVRHRGMAWLIRVMGVLAIGWMIGLGLSEPRPGRPDPVVVAGPAAVLFALATLRLGWMGVVVTNEGVTVRNRFRTVRVGWDDVERFGAAETPFEPRAAVLVLRSGGNVPLHGLAGSNPRLFPKSTSTQDCIDVLNAEIVRRRPPWGPGRRPR